ncbi:MAG: hypothetical protein ACO3EO_07475, partial [Candidatus Kapaibacteriota bacterium]
ESIVSVEESIQEKKYVINGLTFSFSNEHASVILSSIDGRILKKGIADIQFQDLPDGVYVISTPTNRFIPKLILKIGNQLIPQIGS